MMLIAHPVQKVAAILPLFTTTSTFCSYQHQQHRWHVHHNPFIFHSKCGRPILIRMTKQTNNNNNNSMKMMSSSSASNDKQEDESSSVWQATPLATSEDIALAKSLSIWPLDEFNADLLNEVRPRDYVHPAKQQKTTRMHHHHYDLVVIGAGAGGLVSSRQAARRGAKSCMISAELAGGDCLNAGCVPSKALLRCAKKIREIRSILCDDDMHGFGVSIHAEDSASSTSTVHKKMNLELSIHFPQIMRRMRKLRSQIAPIDGHARGISMGTHIYQGRGIFTSPNTVEVIPYGKVPGDASNPILTFGKAVIATGGTPYVPSSSSSSSSSSSNNNIMNDIPGLHSAPYTTNLNLFNLQVLPPRMVILGSGIVALEMAQAFATFGSKVTILQRSSTLFSSGGRKSNEEEEEEEEDAVARVLQAALEKEGVTFLRNVVVKEVRTLREASDDTVIESTDDDEIETLPRQNLLPLMQLSLTCNSLDDEDQNNEAEGTNKDVDFHLECECLLLAMGRRANVQNMGLNEGNIQYHPNDGVLVNDYSQSISNPNVYAVGDCVAYVPRLTHMSGEMAKVVVQNALFRGTWKLSSLVVPAVMYTDPEYAVVRSNLICLNDRGHVIRQTNKDVDLTLDTYKADLKHNDRAILDGTDEDGFVIVRCHRGTGNIVSCTIVSTRAGEMINEVSLAMKHGIDLEGIGRNIHAYPTLGEAVMSCGLQYINSKWETM